MGFLGIPSPFGKYDKPNQWLDKNLGDHPDPQDTAGVRPDYPGYTPLLDPNGQLKSPYMLKGQGNVGFTSNLSELDKRLNADQLNTQGLEEIRKRALSTGPSEWANLMTQQQGLEENKARQNAGEQEASARSEALSGLASKGGLSSGARERLATAGANNYAKSLQDVGLQGQQQRLGIGVQDQANQLQLLQGLPGMELAKTGQDIQKTGMWSGLANDESGRKQALDLSNRDYTTGVDQFNLKNTLGEVGRNDQLNMDAYKEKMAGYAAAKSSDALANNKSSGGKK